MVYANLNQNFPLAILMNPKLVHSKLEFIKFHTLMKFLAVAKAKNSNKKRVIIIIVKVLSTKNYSEFLLSLVVLGKNIPKILPHKQLLICSSLIIMLIFFFLWKNLFKH